MSDWRYRDRFCTCSVGGRFCNLWKFCHCCRHFRRLRLLGTFLPRYSAGQWFFQTISFAGSLPLESPFLSDIELCWDSVNAAVRSLVSDHHLAGAVKVEELSICSFKPLRVLPHCHLLLAAETIPPSVLEELRGRIQACQPASLGSDNHEWQISQKQFTRLPPTTRTRAITSPSGLAQAISYLVKPIDMVSPYQAALGALGNAPDGTWVINGNVSEFLEGHSELTFQRRQIEYMGNLDARTRARFIGVHRRERQSRTRQLEVIDLLQECNEDPVGLDDSPWLEYPSNTMDGPIELA